MTEYRWGNLAGQHALKTLSPWQHIMGVLCCVGVRGVVLSPSRIRELAVTLERMLVV